MTRFDHPMSPVVWRLAEDHGLVLANRLATRHHLFDGRTLATWWLRDRKGHRQVLPLSDHDILHEIAHYLAAESCQKDLPEYGLGSLVSQFGQTYTPGVVDEPEGEIQEFLAQLLSVHWGKTYGLPSAILSDEPNWVTDWDEYLTYKVEQNTTSPSWISAKSRFVRLQEAKVV